MPSEERIALSDFVIRNDGGLDELRKAVDEICDSLREGLKNCS